MLVINDVTLGFGNTPLFAPISIKVAAGDIALLTAPSGMGKSTLLRWICGMTDAGLSAKGDIFLDGALVNDVAIEKRQMGMMFQEPLMFPHLTVAGNLAFGLKRSGTGAERKSIIAAQLEEMGMAGMEDRDPMTLSGGQKARVALIRCMLAQPKALLLDEPFSGLDDVTREDFADLVKRAVRARKLPVLMVSHDPRDRNYADHPPIPLYPFTEV